MTSYYKNIWRDQPSFLLLLLLLYLCWIFILLFRNSLRRIATNDDTEFSRESIVNLMEKFVKTVNVMDETILVPCRLMDRTVRIDWKQIFLFLKFYKNFDENQERKKNNNWHQIVLECRYNAVTVKQRRKKQLKPLCKPVLRASRRRISTIRIIYMSLSLSRFVCLIKQKFWWWYLWLAPAIALTTIILNR